MGAALNSVGERIREARLARGLTQAQLARGIASKGFISQIERDRALPSLPRLGLIADRLGLALSDLAGGPGPRELAYLRKSAELAVKAGEPARAVELTMEALGLARDGGERASILRTQGLALDAMGRYAQALEAHQAAAAATPEDEPDLAAAIYVEIGTVLQEQERFNVAVEANLRALSWLDRSKRPDPALRSRALANLSTDAYNLGQSARSLRYAEDALAAATDAESIRRMAKAHHALSQTARQAGDVEKAIEHCDRALEIYGRIRDERSANQVLNNLGDAQYAAGRKDEARECQERCLSRARELGDPYAAGASATELARYALEAADFEGAIAYAREGQQAAAEANDHLHRAMSLAYEARAQDRLGHPTTAALRFRDACRLLLEREAVGKLAEVCVMYSDILRARNQVDRAFAFLRMASERDFKQLPDLLTAPTSE